MYSTILLLLASGAVAKPIPGSASKPQLNNKLFSKSEGSIVPINQARHHVFTRQDSGEVEFMFDASQSAFANHEMNMVRNKYSNSMQYLSGCQLAQVDANNGDASDEQASIQMVSNGTIHSNSNSIAFSAGLSIAASQSQFSTSTGMSLVPSASSTSMFASSAVVTTASSATAAPTSQAGNPMSAIPTSSAILQLPKRDSASSLGLTDYISGSMDVLYYGPINIGTPSQEITVDFDTGSADLWLPVNCQNCQSKQFQASKSPTYKSTGQKFSVEYGSGSVSGVLAQENVKIAGTSVMGQYFGAVNQESDDFFGNPNSGVLGMAFGAIATSNKPTYFENLMSSKAVSNPLFGFHLTRKQASGSSLCLGCQDSSKYTGAINWIPVVSKTYWSVSMTGLSALSSKKNSLDKSLIGAIDTGTTLIYVPTAVADKFYAQIPGAASASDQFGEGFYQFPCKTSAQISISFNGKPFAVNMADFNLGKTSSGGSMCVGGVLGIGSGFPDNLAIVGDAFLKSWYSIYDYSNGARVGLASSINNK